MGKRMRCAQCEATLDVLDACEECAVRTGWVLRAVYRGRPRTGPIDIPGICIRGHEKTWLARESRWRCRECSAIHEAAKRLKAKRQRAA